MDTNAPQQPENYLTQQVVPPPVNTNIPPVESSAPTPQSRPKYMAIAALVGILALGGLVYMFTMVRNAIQPAPAPTSVAQTPTDTPKPTQPAPDGALWQLYADQEIGMKFEYSTDWTALPISDGYNDKNGVEVGHGRVGLIAQKDFANGVYNPRHREIVRVYDWDNLKGLSLKDYNASITFTPKSGAPISSPNLYSATTKPTKLAGLSAYYDPHADCAPFSCEQYILAKGKKFIEIKFINNLNDPNYPEPQSQIIFDHIIETLTM